MVVRRIPQANTMSGIAVQSARADQQGVDSGTVGKTGGSG
jgi:hypothetical protein